MLFPPAIVEARGEDAIALDLLHILLGEPLEERDVDGEMVPFIAATAEVKDGSNLRKAIAMNKRSKSGTVLATALDLKLKAKGKP